MNPISVAQGAELICNGGVVAYPTEGCYGLGCNPMNAEAVKRILNIKRRHFSKGLILVGDHINRFDSYFTHLPETTAQEIMASWPGPVTWLLPASRNVPRVIRGNHQSIALRVSKHPVVRMLCREANMAIVSTSANRAAQMPLRALPSVMAEFGEDVDGIVAGRIGQRRNPSVIRNSRDGSYVRV